MFDKDVLQAFEPFRNTEMLNETFFFSGKQIRQPIRGANLDCQISEERQGWVCRWEEINQSITHGYRQ